MSETQTIHCPHCNQPYSMTPEQERRYAGQTITCTTCQKPFAVGATPAAAPDAVAADAAPTNPSALVGYAHPDTGAQRTDGFSIASLVCGLILCVPLAPSALATIFGILGIKRTRDPRVGGRGFAIAGLVLGIVGLLGWVAYIALVVVMLIPSLGSARETANRVKCASNMRQIGQALLLYANENNGQYPDSLEPLLLTQDITADVFVCPASNDERAPGVTVEEQAEDLSTGGHLSYVYVGSNEGFSAGAEEVILYEPLSNHDGDGTNILFGDGHVEFVSSQMWQTMKPKTKADGSPLPDDAGMNAP